MCWCRLSAVSLCHVPCFHDLKNLKIRFLHFFYVVFEIILCLNSAILSFLANGFGDLSTRTNFLGCCISTLV